jgi:hypothetical protein
MSGQQTEFGVLHVMPSGARCYFVEDHHGYYRCKADGKRGKRLTGVTTAVKPADYSPDGLMRWAARENGAGIAMLAAEGLGLPAADEIRDALSWLGSAKSIWQALNDAELTYDHIRDKAAKRGTNVHKYALQELAEGQPVPDYEGMTQVERNYARGVEKFWLEHDPEPELAEQVVLDEELGVAGTLDFLGRIRSRPGRGVIDAKTSGFIGISHHMQVALYAHLSEKAGYGKPDWTAILQVDEEGNYVLIPGQATTADALATVDLYRRVGRIEADARRAWKEAA